MVRDTVSLFTYYVGKFFGDFAALSWAQFSVFDSRILHPNCFKYEERSSGMNFAEDEWNMTSQPKRRNCTAPVKMPAHRSAPRSRKRESQGNLWRRMMLIAAGCVFLATGFSRFIAAQQPAPPQAPIGDKYEDLLPEQKVLVDDWFRRFAEVVKKTVPVQEGYNNLPISTKTTFGAVTHALIHTTLMDEAGTSLGASAITLIDRLDTVAGKIEGASGDQQFRIYVVLKPNALEILARSKEFGRGPDNVVFHKGYPICYRSRNGTPSLQVSAARDGKQADIDVDYRSSKFPAFLVNGHLSASNSDVRAGDNDERHNEHWSGLSSWWRGFLGLPLFDKGTQSEDLPSKEPITKSSAKPEVAVRDFLQSWLVSQRPDEAASYFAESSLRCRELEGGRPTDLGMAKFSLMMGLKEVNQRIGKATQLSDVIVGVQLTGPRGKPIAQPYRAEFELYDVREDLAEQMKCLNRLDLSNVSTKAISSKSFGKYVGSVFKFKLTGVQTETVAVLWAKQDGYWKIISYDLEPEYERYRVPDTTSPAAVAAATAPPITYVAGDKDLTQKAGDFFNKWFVQGRPAEAFQYLSTRAYPCVNLYRDDDTPAAGTNAEQGRLIQTGMERVSSLVGPIRKLEEGIAAPNVSHPDVRLVKHPQSKAFVLVSVPDHMAAAAGCQERKPGEDLYFQEPGTGKVYGNYYATGFRVLKSVGDPSVLWTVWTKDAGEWKIVSYFLLTP